MIDTHAHIDDEKLNSKTIIKNMKTDGLSKIITIGTSKDDIKNVTNLADSNENIFACIGIHPYFADTVNAKLLAQIKDLSASKKVVGIGEFGLDYHDEGLPVASVQKEAMLAQIKLAHDLSLPICLHIREAHGDALEILKNNKNLLTNSGIIHCYSGSKELVKEYTDLGFYISLSGSITYKKHNEEIIRAIPKDRLLLETDCPYLSPQPLRGTTNEPKNVLVTAQIVADILEMSIENLDKLTTENTYRLFKKLY